ncbi:hypothetical protein IM40_10125 (plasmid) [Candidatus Paracaedimonas acanthamoebae]|nr:hypothetical protein IM40_10125 [Candidatus Paracaedimonas acanthamoebae]
MTKSPQCNHVDFSQLENDFSKGNILRTMTCLNKKGKIHLYYIKDKNEKNNKKVISFLQSFQNLELSSINNFFSRFYSN